MLIMGIDPGLGATGYGVLDTSAGRFRVVAAGDIRPPRSEPIAERLGVIRDELSALIARYHPAAAVLEKLFTHHSHVTTAALMGHARGAACLAVRDHGLPLAEYLPTQVKKSLTGRGHATKDQVLRMVGVWLGAADAAWSSDAADALALAIVHAHTAAQTERLPAGMTR
jgi:crossover junction endodeoxyribonuclease RuvC